ncbi:hypothetical protein SeLEV6574_g00224 [Synchytrium endobioticum]|uniref:Uncharacterized protein n=1 Tax=Synchytrium endobioticum TaxID=286115 RepID=A0A507DJ28_9FUNG|nr:hypothetical protein SeLEV6574_g00224 [Synchytrium endobioticum]
MAKAPRARAEETHIAGERQRRPAMRMGALGHQEVVHAGDAAGSRPRRQIQPPGRKWLGARPTPRMLPPRLPRTPRERAPSAFIVPDPVNLDFPYPDDDEAAGDVHTQPDMDAYGRLPIGLRQESTLFVERLAAALGPRASTEARRLMASITDRCLIRAPPQRPNGLANIVVGATAVALPSGDSSVEVFPLLAEITGLRRALIVRLQRALLRAIDYSYTYIRGGRGS